MCMYVYEFLPSILLNLSPSLSVCLSHPLFHPLTLSYPLTPPLLLVFFAALGFLSPANRGSIMIGMLCVCVCLYVCVCVFVCV
jgi:hypothetical protein